MGLLSEYFSLTTFVCLVATIILFFKWRFTYWKRLGAPQLSPIIPFGDMKYPLLLKRSLGEQYTTYYKKIREMGHKFAGLYLSSSPVMVIADSELTKTMLVKDFSHFVNHGIFFDAETDPLSGHLFNLEDNAWKLMRQKLTPTFTSGKIKVMFETINNCALYLETIMDNSIENGKPLDIKDVIGRYGLDVIGSVAFGIECNTLKNPDCEFRVMSERIFTNTLWDNVSQFLSVVIPRSLIQYTNIRNVKSDVSKFFMSAIVNVVELRESKNIQRKDFLQLLLQLKNQENKDGLKNMTKKEQLTLNELAAQAYVFFVAGFETTSTTLNFAIYQLAMNPVIQDKLRDEIHTTLNKYDGKICYEAISEMTYMERVIQETLRMFPPGALLFRKCTKDYIIPNSTVCIQKGVDVIFPIEGIHYDPENYPDPEIFNPDRFGVEDKNQLPMFSFGDGPRICIGMRFAMVEMKIALTHIIGNYKMSLNPNTKLPLEYLPSYFVKCLKYPILIDVNKA